MLKDCERIPVSVGCVTKKKRINMEKREHKELLSETHMECEIGKTQENELDYGKLGSLIWETFFFSKNEKNTIEPGEHIKENA